LDIEPFLEGLLLVVLYLREHPRPNCFPRELPLPISTKLVEQHSKLLSEWLDMVLPDNGIDHNFSRDRFAKRYGFREQSEHYLIRLLNEHLLAELQCPGTELSLPLESLTPLPVKNARVLVVENKTNLLTLPDLTRTIAMGGLGYSVSRFFEVPWLAMNDLSYWGDLDVDGFRILANLRERFPRAKSLMMDAATLDRYRDLLTIGNDAIFDCPTNLYPSVQEAFRQCRQHNRRLEQERIPQLHVVEYLRNQFSIQSGRFPDCFW
jgi:hypothetical protein